MHAAATPVDDRPTTVRSKITNGKRLHACVDGRSANARRFRDLVQALTADVGGDVGLSVADRSLIRQAATLLLRTEQLQAATVRGEAVDSDALIRLSGEARRILASLRRRAPAAEGPSLAEHLARRAAERASEQGGPA